MYTDPVDWATFDPETGAVTITEAGAYMIIIGVEGVDDSSGGELYRRFTGCPRHTSGTSEVMDPTWSRLVTSKQGASIVPHATAGFGSTGDWNYASLWMQRLS